MAQNERPVFLSYCRVDTDFAKQLAGDLKAAGRNVWLDQLDITLGQRWDRAIQDALIRCPCMLVILSPASVDSDNVMDEVNFALENHKVIIPVIHKDCTVPFRLRRLQYADFTQYYARGLTTLLQTLSPEQLAEQSTASSQRQTSQTRTITTPELIVNSTEAAKNSNLAAGKEFLTLQGHTDSVHSVAWSPDGNKLATASGDKTAKVWDVRTGRELLTLPHRQCVRTVAWSLNPGTKCLATASTDGLLNLWDLNTGESLFDDILQGDGCLLAWRPYLYAESSPGAEDCWGWLANIHMEGSQPAGVAVRFVATGALTVLLHSDVVRCIAWSSDGERLATGTLNGTVRVWSVDWNDGAGFGAGRELLTLKGHSACVTSVAWAMLGNQLATGSEDGKVKVWNTMNGKQLLTITPADQPSEVSSVAWSTHRNWLATASQDKTVKVWDGETGKEVLTINDHRGAIRSVAWSPCGKRLATGSEDKTAKVWDIREEPMS